MRRVIPGLKKLPNLKPEVLAALLCFIFLMLISIVHLIIVLSDIDNVRKAWESTLIPMFLIAFFTPVVVYFGVKTFLAPPKSPFPDIDLAFEAGVSAMDQHGIGFKEAPLYLVLGTPDSKTVSQIMESSGRSFDFTSVTAQGQALHWYGSQDHVYLFLTGIGNVGQLTKDLAKYVSLDDAEDGEPVNHDLRNTIDVRALRKGKHQGVAPASAQGETGPLTEGGNFTKTMKPGEAGVAPTPMRVSKIESRPRAKNTRPLSSREKLANQKKRLSHLCELIARRRKPVCGLNGIIVAMASKLIEEFPGELARQLRSDLSTISSTTGVVTTVTAIVSGFEKHRGCREFVLRLSELQGKEILSRRFGKSYRSWENPTAEQLGAISSEAIESFDQYIYSIFTDREALSSRHVDGNRNMVKFLCWIYASFFEGLEITLSSGFNIDSSGGDDFPRFAGCYFLGIGDSDESKFFAKGVFDRVDENQGELEWTRAVGLKEESLLLVSQLVFLAGLLAIATLAVLLVFYR